jgi:hypothetical protein
VTSAPGWLAGFIAALAFLAAGPAAASDKPCAAGRDSYFIDWMVVSAPRASFYSEPSGSASAPAKGKGYLVRGDFVFARITDPPEYPPTGMEAGFRCVSYVRPNGARTYGWLRRSDLVVLQSRNEVEGPEPPASVKSLLAQMPSVTSWPEAGKSPDAVHREKNFEGDFLCIRRFDAEKKQLCVLTTSRSPGGPECGALGPGNRYAMFDAEGWYVAYLFNNGIVIVSETGMWGNHGQSDPEGLYVPSAAAARACPDHMAPRSH